MLKLYAIALSLIAGNAFASGSELIVSPTNLTAHTKSAAAIQRTNVLAGQKNFKNATLVDINRNAFQSNIVNIDFRGYHFQYIKTGGDTTDAANWSWTGNADKGIGDAVVTSYQGTLVGSFHYQGVVLNLEQTGPDEYMLEELGERNGKPTGADGANIADGQERALQIDKAKKKLTEANRATAAVATAATATPTIRVLVVYDAAAGSANQVNANVTFVMNDLNTIMRNSGVNATATLATTPIAITYSGARDTTSTFNAFQTMQNVQAYHDNYQADVMIMLASLSDLCGLANILPAPGAAYAVVDASCMMTEHTFAHEFAHLLGAGHDIQNKNPNGAQPYAHGLLFANFSYYPAGNPSIEYFWCTHSVMAYSWDTEDPEPNGPCISDPILALFTSPLITFKLNSGATSTFQLTEYAGVANQDDNARMMNESAATVATNHLTHISNQPIAYKMVLTPAAMTLHVGETEMFSFDSYNSSGAVVGNPPSTTQVWTSADPTIVAMAPTGVAVTGVAVGTTHITLTDAQITIPSVSAVVNVIAPSVLTSINASPIALGLTVGTSGSALTVSGLDQYGKVMALNGATSWSSANPAVASVDSNGNVVPVSIGSTTVAATNSGLSVSVTVTVSGKPGIGNPTCGRACSNVAPAQPKN